MELSLIKTRTGVHVVADEGKEGRYLMEFIVVDNKLTYRTLEGLPRGREFHVGPTGRLLPSGSIVESICGPLELTVKRD